MPRWRPSRWCAVVGGRGFTGVVNAGRPSFSSPSCQLSDPGRVGDLLALPSTTRSNSAVATLSVHRWSRARFLPLRVVSPILEPKRAINAKPADASDRGLPLRLIVANQQVCRSGLPVPGACVTPLLRRASTPLQSRRGDS